MLASLTDSEKRKSLLSGEVRYFSMDDVTRTIHRLGLGRIRDIGLLESALHRPQTVVFGVESYIGIFDKAAALLQSLVKNHALFDGNKRLALSATVLFLGMNGFELLSGEEETFQFMLACARGDLELDDISTWLSEHIEPIS
jgi:death-on-curing protein